MRKWQLQDAKAKFSELLNASITEGPQIVTRRGVEAAVLVDIELWRRLQTERRPGLKALLLAAEPKVDEDLAPDRRHYTHRPPPIFE